MFRSAAIHHALPLVLLSGCYGAPVETSICTPRNVAEVALAGDWVATDPQERQWRLRLERKGVGLFNLELTGADKDDTERYQGQLCVARVNRAELASVRMEFSSRYFLYKLTDKGKDGYDASAFAADDDQDISPDVEKLLRQASKKAKIQCERPFLNDGRCQSRYLSVSQEELARIATAAQGVSLWKPMFRLARERSGEK